MILRAPRPANVYHSAKAADKFTTAAAEMPVYAAIISFQHISAIRGVSRLSLLVKNSAIDEHGYLQQLHVMSSALQD